MAGRLWFVLGALMGAAGVALGAYAAHGLDKHLLEAGTEADKLPQLIENFRTAAHYQLTHAVALALVGLAARSWPSRGIPLAGVCFLSGIALFSGGLYAMVLGVPLHWSIVPIGGVLLIAGWLALGIAVLAGGRVAAPAAE